MSSKKTVKNSKKKFIVADYYVQEGDEFMKTDSSLELHTEKLFDTKEEAKAWILDEKRQILEARDLSEDDSGIEIVEENDGMLVMTYKVEDYGLELWHWQAFEIQPTKGGQSKLAAELLY